MGRTIAKEVKKATGAYKKNPQRENKASPNADGLDPAMPEHFNADEQQKWHEMLGYLRGNGVLSSDTAEILMAYCSAYGGWIAARRSVREIGMVIESQDKLGQTVYTRNPMSVELHKYSDTMNRLLPELGLTPASRQKLVMIKPAEEENPFKMILNRMGQG